MSMQAKDNVSTKAQRAVCPVEFKNRTYIKLEKGQTHTIDSVIYSTYLVKDADGSNKLSKAGNPIFKTTAYIGLENNQFTTISNNTAISQLISLTGDFDEYTEGHVKFEGFDQKVMIISDKVTYNDKSWEILVFEPIDSKD